MTPKPLLPVDDARARILADAPPLGLERQALSTLAMDPLPWHLGVDVVARRAMPAFDNSAMDGYAVRAEDCASPGATLRVVGRVLAGDALAGDGADAGARPLGPGEARSITTGAPIPPGCTAVVMRERCDESGVATGPNEDGTGTLVVQIAVPDGDNIRRRGEDVDVDGVVGRRHDVLTPARLNLLWSAGLTAVDVIRRPRVAILASGDELVELGEPAADHQVINSNAWAVAAAARRLGAEVRLLGIARDSLEDHVARMDVDDVDVLITIGGVSMGSHDFVRPALLELGATLHLWKLAMRPGKPLAFGSIPRGQRRPVLVFGLPGNPVSALVTFTLFAAPALRQLAGAAGVPAVVDGDAVEAVFADDAPMTKKPGLRVFARAVTEPGPDGPRVRPVERQSSGQISGLADATALLDLGVDVTTVEPGSRVRVIPLR